MQSNSSEVHTAYEGISSRFTLPAYGQLNQEFDLDGIELGKRRVLKEVAKAMFERVNSFRIILESVVQPERVSEMQETEFLNEQERIAVADMLRHFMQLDRMMLSTELDNGDIAYAQFIMECWTQWQKLKPQTQIIIHRLEEGWKKPYSIRSSPQYLG